MNREEAKALLPIIQAFAEGKTIQMEMIDGTWTDREQLSIDDIEDIIDSPKIYRIKPESKYRPFANAEECWKEMLQHVPFGWIKQSNGTYSLITTVSNLEDNVSFGACDFDFDYLLDDCTFCDGSPFGIKVED